MFNVKRETLDNVEEFQTAPRKTTCRHCDRQVLTLVESVNTWKTLVAGIICVVLFSWFAFCILPLVLPLTMDSCHYCPKCQNLLGRSSRCSFIPASASKEIITVRVGNCAIILSQRYIWMGFSAALGISSVVALRFYFQTYGLPNIPRGEPSDVTWPDFLAECGARASLGNPIRAERTFNDQFAHRTVTWTGRLLKVVEGFWGKNILYMLMEPHQMQKAFSPDIAIVFDKAHNSEIADLQAGDMVQFDATMVELGKRGHPHLAFLWEIYKIRDARSLPTLPEKPDALKWIMNQARPSTTRAPIRPRVIPRPPVKQSPPVPKLPVDPAVPTAGPEVNSTLMLAAAVQQATVPVPAVLPTGPMQ
ncbi:MAG: uncharacterized protein KVP18_003532 [Porospora cf. gigantea A]|uniref:uncharacterized protein n=1 Tax=Porospora cf. gigantea A TaxID=2853593 RepID=UPI00355A003C|nr:MAG: hypothetical protein KVP18_003532 [Porospora cf. gigantea A]